MYVCYTFCWDWCVVEWCVGFHLCDLSMHVVGGFNGFCGGYHESDCCMRLSTYTLVGNLCWLVMGVKKLHVYFPLVVGFD